MTSWLGLVTAAEAGIASATRLSNCITKVDLAETKPEGSN